MNERHFEFWPRRMLRTLTLPRTSVYHNLKVSAEKYPEKTAIIYYGTEIPYERLHDEVHALAGYLQQDLGAKKVDRVVLSAPGRVHRRITQERVRQDPLARAPGEGARKAVGRQRLATS